ncbi:MAG: hypothetical protein HC905_00700 [Bacteroidales bacterium]|nr:hypothetical protein [Bacteroidales bacterium]
MASRKPAAKRELKRKYKGHLPIKESYEDYWYKYSIGDYNTYNEARTISAQCNVKDNFIATYSGNNRVQIIFNPH